jgi:SAM-dependent methyltransferase
MASEPPPKTYSSVFKETINEVPAAVAELLESYSGIPRDQQIAHIVECRNEAYAKCPYPCIGNMRFLDFDLSLHPLYADQILDPLKRPMSREEGEAEPLFLDLGTCFGQDVRKLVYDGAPIERVWASDIEPHLIDAGFRLFNDEAKLPRDHFLCPGDLFSASPDDRLRALDDRVTILHMTAVFHLFGLEDQKKVVDRCLRLLRKDAGRPVLLLGMQVGSVVAGPFLRENHSPEFSHKYRHNVESWASLWHEVCGRDEWKDRIDSLEVTSQLFQNGSKPQSADKPSSGDSNVRRHVFEVWVTFK